MRMDIRVIKKIRYPDLETIMHQYPNPEMMLGREIRNIIKIAIVLFV